MAKLNTITQLAQDSAVQVSSSTAEWTRFLNTSARLYRYPFPDQLLIHVQRPDAVACASYELWNDVMKRYIKKGSKGIALIDHTGDYPRIRHVFDYSDTKEYFWEQSYKPNLWELKDRNIPAVAAMLHSTYDGAQSKDVDGLLYEVSRQLADEYYNDNKNEITEQLCGSSFDGLDENTVHAQFNNTLVSSITYTLMKRCGRENEGLFKNDVFQHLKKFNTVESITALGTAASQISEQVLKEIGKTVKTYERNLKIERSSENERHTIQTDRGLSDTRPDGTEHSEPTARPVRADVQSTPSDKQEDEIQHISSDRGNDKLPERNRPDRERTDSADNERIKTGKPAAGQVHTSPRVDTPHEHPVPSSRGIGDNRPDTQHLKPLFPTEKQQTQTIAGANAPAISQSEIDSLLRLSIEAPESRKRIYGQFIKNPRSREASRLIKEEYGKCEYTTPRTDGKPGYMGLASEDTGVSIVKGEPFTGSISERPKQQTVSLSWREIQQRLEHLIQNGKYLSQSEQDAYAANILDSFNHDLSDVINNSLLRQEHKEKILSFIKMGSTDNQLTDYLSKTFPKKAETFLLNTGETANYFTTPNGIRIEIQDKYNSKFNFSWIDIAPIIRRLSKDWEQNVQKPVQQEVEPEQTTETAGAVEPPHREDDTPAHTPVNFHITDMRLGVAGDKEKYRNNVQAIRLLKDIEADKRLAAPEEQEILARYVGWGGISQAFDPKNEKWQNEYTELKELLSPDEYSKARGSTLNAHYTSPTVIKAIYDTIGRMGIKNGNILEPACGTGNFFGMLPEEMANSSLYGVELDSVTGRIAQQLYQNANITVSGFEKTEFPNDFFDVAIGNVPFGNYKVADKDYDHLNYNIHDYFFAKSFDKVRPGGIVAFVTSKGTMDKQNPEVRRYLAQHGELLGAVRLPNNAFKDNAGTEVTTDILFFQKRDMQIYIEPDWVHLGMTPDGVPVNSYFADNPHMVLGHMEFSKNMYGNENETACVPIPGTELSQQLKNSLLHINAEYEELSLDDLPEREKEYESIPADLNVKNFSFTLIPEDDYKDGEVFYRENSRMYRRKLPKATTERVRGMVALRDCVQTLIKYQLEDYSDTVIRQEQSRLNSLYDTYTKKYGLINSKGNSMAFSDDSAYYLLCSLEHIDEDGKLEKKADMFYTRTIKKSTPVTHVNTANEALAVSIAEKACVDLGFMHSLSGLSHEQLVKDLEGVIYRIPEPNAGETKILNAKWVTSDEYLSGNVREKLQTAKEYAEQYPAVFTINAEALTAAQPKDLDASEINVRLGAEWIGKEYIQQFMTELLEPGGMEQYININYLDYTGEWNIKGKNVVSSGNVLANVTYGTSRANAYKLLENALNLRDTRIYDVKVENGNEKRVLNKKETMLAQQKQEAIKEQFKDWIFQDPDRRQYLVEKYNHQFNSTKPREYNGEHITFTGMSPDIIMRPHQNDAVAHQLYGGNTLLAHEVGAGKTFEMVAAAMESKRL